MNGNSEETVEHLFRTEYGKVLSVLTRFFGPSYLELAEDMVQETLISALDHWSKTGIPENPTGWLVQVAKRKALNELKRNEMMQKHHASGVMSEEVISEIDPVYLKGEVEDSQLRMIFTCCHPALNTESQIALTLKTLCGFGVKEVAHALLTTESTINKRLYRAKTKIRESEVPFSIPQGEELSSRLEAVSLTLYLLFNEGYNSSHSDSVIRKELCLEAIRLTRLLVEHMEENHQLSALLSLMCFHVARFDARIDDHGAIVLFEDQDRSRWNKDLIHIGMNYLKTSIQGDAVSAYHIEARIAAEHCTSESFEQTNWQLIYDQYVLLQQLKPNPVIRLNLAIIQSQLSGIKASLILLNELAQSNALKEYHLLPATQGIFYMKLENYDEAVLYLNKALWLKPSGAEADFIRNKIAECKTNSRWGAGSD